MNIIGNESISSIAAACVYLASGVIDPMLSVFTLITIIVLSLVYDGLQGDEALA